MQELIKPKYTRVTDILYPFSKLDKIDPVILKNAARRGTEVHKTVECIIKGLGRFDTPDTKPYIDSFEQWYKGQKFIVTSKRFYDDEYMITGECDGIYESDEGLVLVDFKTPRKPSLSWMLQGSAYSYMAKKHGYDIKKIEFINLLWTGKFEKPFVYEENFDLFLNCFHAYKYFFEKEPNPVDTDYI